MSEKIQSSVLVEQQRPHLPELNVSEKEYGRGSVPSTLSDDDNQSQPRGSEGTITPPKPAPIQQQKWNEPRGNIVRLVAAFWSMMVFGASDAAYGALLPYLQRYYNISYIVVSLIFLCQLVGFSLSAVTNPWIHYRFGQRGIAILSPTCHLIAFVIISLHPPWPVVIIGACFSSYANGLIDAAWSSWTGHMEAGNVLEGALHAFYALGCTFSPLIATELVVTAGLPWYTFFYILSGMSALALVLQISTFWKKNGEVYAKEHMSESTGAESTKAALRSKVTWLSCAYFLMNVGSEIALGGWIVSFMLEVRKATPYVSGVVGTGFWAGMTLGRSGLGVVTHYLIEITNRPHKKGFIYNLRLTERSISTVYLSIAIGLQLIFWLVPSVLGSAVSVAFLGLFLGPTFPSGIVAATKLLPRNLHVPSVGLSTAVGGCGGAIFPFVIGVLAEARGVAVLQPFALAMLVVLLSVWLFFPRLPSKSLQREAESPPSASIA